MNNNILDKTSFYGGLNLNPIPLEFSQELTTTKWLLGMDKKLSSIIDKVNEWYDTLLNDIENGGELFQKINTEILSEFSTTINNLNSGITNLNNIVDSISDNITDLNNTINYVAPSITIVSQPAPSIHEIGATMTELLLTNIITLGSLKNQKIEYYKNDVLINSKTLTGSETQDFYIDSNIKTTSIYKSKLYDSKHKYITQQLAFYFVYPFYIGNTSNAINETTLKSLTKSLQYKGSFKGTFNANGTKVIISYPSAYGDLTNILDRNKIDLIEDFDKTNLNITCADNTVQQYNVYSSKNVKYLSAYDLYFIFDGDTTIINQDLIINFTSENGVIDGGKI